MRTIIIDEADANFGQTTTIFNSPNRTIIGMVNDLGVGADLQQIISSFNELKQKYDDVLNRLEVVEGKLEDSNSQENGLVKVGQIIELDLVVSDMSAYMGYGSWELFGRGRFTLCSGSTVDSNGESQSFQVSQQGGAYRHTLTEGEMPEHDHEIDLWYPTDTERSNHVGLGRSGKYSTDKTLKTGGGLPHNNMPPYVVVQRWKRVS